jgi:hypothetical protein
MLMVWAKNKVPIVIYAVQSLLREKPVGLTHPFFAASRSSFPR